jgi:hypothetical protein
MLGLYKFYWDCGRMGNLSGIFIHNKDTVHTIYGKHIGFGDVLGKHSNIHGTVEESDITLLTDDQDFINKAIEVGLVSTGYNPFDYYEEFIDDPE